MKRRHFLAGAASLLSAADSAREGHGGSFNKLVGGALEAGPWSVTSHRPKGLKIDAGPNDYFSEGPYWWPDPKNPDGPYIRKDGQRNPERFLGNRDDLGSFSTAVLA